MDIKYYFDSNTKGLYDEENKPTGSKELSFDEYLKLVNAASAGYEISCDSSGNPVLVKIDNSTEAEISWRNNELVRADYELNKVQDADPKAVGTVGDWRVYRKALRQWPESSDFPDKNKRPIPPSA